MQNSTSAAIFAFFIINIQNKMQQFSVHLITLPMDYMYLSKGKIPYNV